MLKLKIVYYLVKTKSSLMEASEVWLRGPVPKIPSLLQPVAHALLQSGEEVEKIMFQEGEKLANEVNVYSLPTDLYPLLGRMKFRTSYGQNLLVHTLEETKIGIHIAQEIGANVDVVRLGCLFHDIGKVLEGDGSHVKLGVETCSSFLIYFFRSDATSSFSFSSCSRFSSIASCRSSNFFSNSIRSCCDTVAICFCSKRRTSGDVLTKSM